MADDFYPPYDEEPQQQPPPQPESQPESQPPPNFVPYKPEVQAQADQPPPNFIPYRPEPPEGFIPYKPQAEAPPEPIKSAPAGATPEERRLIYGDEPLGTPPARGGLSPTAAPTVTSTVPPQDIPAPKTNKAGETLPTYIIKSMAEGLKTLPQRAFGAAGELQRQGDVYRPDAIVETVLMGYGARSLAGMTQPRPLAARPIPPAAHTPGTPPVSTVPEPPPFRPPVTPEGQYQFPVDAQHQLGLPTRGGRGEAPPRQLPLELEGGQSGGTRQGELPLGDEAQRRQGQTPGSDASAGVAQEPRPPTMEPVADAQNKTTLGDGAKETGGENLNTRDYGKKTPGATGEATGVNVLKDGVDPTLAHTVNPDVTSAPATPEAPPVRPATAEPGLLPEKQPFYEAAKAAAPNLPPEQLLHIANLAGGPKGAALMARNAARRMAEESGAVAPPAARDMPAPVERAPVPEGTMELPTVEVKPGTAPTPEAVTQAAEATAQAATKAPEPTLPPSNLPTSQQVRRMSRQQLTDLAHEIGVGEKKIASSKTVSSLARHVLDRVDDIGKNRKKVQDAEFKAQAAEANIKAAHERLAPEGTSTPESFWSYKPGSPTPTFEQLPPGVFKGNKAQWEAFSPGMRREIVRDAQRARSEGALQKLQAEKPTAVEAKPAEPTPAKTYDEHLQAVKDASAEFRQAQAAYRERKIGDAEFLAARAKHEEAARAFDVVRGEAPPEAAPAPAPGSKAAQRAEAARAVEAFEAKKAAAAAPDKPPLYPHASLPKPKLEKAYEKARAESSKITDEMIAAGRGRETGKDILKQTDELSQRYKANSELVMSLADEMNRRKTWGGTLKPIPEAHRGSFYAAKKGQQFAPQEQYGGRAPPKVTPDTRPIEPTGRAVPEGARAEVNKLLDQTISAENPAAHLRETAVRARELGLEGQARRIEAAAAEMERQRTVEFPPGPGERSTGTLRQQAEHDPMDMVRKGELSAARAEELATHYKNRDKEIVDAVLGKDADAWRRAHKMSDQYWESGYNDAKARVQDKLIEALEAKHSPKAIEEMYRKMEQSEHADPQGWRDFARDLRDVEGSRENAVTTVGYTLRRLPEPGKALGQIDRETLALVQHALDHEARRGGAPEPFLREAFAKSSERYGGGADAAEIIAGDMARLKELMTNPPQERPALPAPAQRLIEFLKDERGGLFFGRKPSRTPAEEKVLSRLAPDPGLLDNFPKTKEEFSSGWRDFYAGFKNELDAIEQLKHRSLDPVAPEVDPGVLARLTRGLGGRVNQTLNDGVYSVKTRQIVGEPLRPTLDKIKADEPGFNAYAMSRTALERDALGIKTGIDIKAANQVIAQNGARWGPVSNELNVWKNHMLDNAVDILGSKAIADMKAKFPGHIALHRMVDSASETGQSLGGGLQARNPLHRLEKGSEAPILNPIDSTIKDGVALLDMAERNRVGLAMVELNDKLGPNAKFMREVKDVHPLHISAAEVNKHLGVEGISEQVVDGFKVFRKGAFTPAPDRIRVFKDGKATTYEVPESLGKAYHQMDAQSLHVAVKILGAPARWLRAGAVLAPEFAFKNPFRDQLAGFTQTKYGYIPVYDFLVHGLPNLFTRGGRHTELFQRMAIEGMFNANMVSMDRRLMYTEPRTLLQHTANVVTTPIRLLQAVSEVMENATRLGVARRAIESPIFNRKAGGAHPIEGAWEGREGTLDFQRVGGNAIQKILNHIIPFYNVTLEGTDRMFRAFRDRPVQTALTTIAGITLPSVGLWYYNKNDERIQQLAQWRKDIAWNFAGRDDWRPISTQGRNEILDGMVERLPGLDTSNLPNTFRQAKDGSWEYNNAIIWAFPKPPGIGQLFGSIPERMLDAYVAKHPDAFKELGKGILAAFSPGILPQAALPEVERWANKSVFMDRTLISPTLQKLPPSQHIAPQTSDTAQAIGKVVRGVIGDKSTLGSPIIIDNYIRQWTGGLGKHVTDMLDYGVFRAKDAPVRPAWSAADVPLLKAFVARFPSSDAEAIKQFYDTYEERKMAAAGIKNLQKKGLPEDPTLLRENPVQGIHTALGVGFKTVRNIMDSKTMSAEDKRAAIDLTYLFMIEKAKQGNKALEESKRKATPPPNFIPYRPEMQ